MAIRGSCHCGAVRFSVDEEPTQAMECNCSICRRKGYLLAFVPRTNFKLDTAREALKAYTFNTHKISHQSCTTCGCGPFAEAEAPDGTPMVAVNMRCIEDFDLSKLTIKQFDGASRR